MEDYTYMATNEFKGSTREFLYTIYLVQHKVYLFFHKLKTFMGFET